MSNTSGGNRCISFSNCRFKTYSTARLHFFPMLAAPRNGFALTGGFAYCPASPCAYQNFGKCRDQAASPTGSRLQSLERTGLSKLELDSAVLHDTGSASGAAKVARPGGRKWVNCCSLYRDSLERRSAAHLSKVNINLPRLPAPIKDSMNSK